MILNTNKRIRAPCSLKRKDEKEKTMDGKGEERESVRDREGERAQRA